MKIVCVECEIELKPEINGQTVIETASFGPYKIWKADRYKCGQCGIEVVTGFAGHSIAEHFEPGFKDVLNRYSEDAVYDDERYRGRRESGVTS